MHPYLKQILEAKKIVMPNGDQFPLKGSISEKQGIFLQRIIKKTKPKVSLEIGLGQGVSAMFICEAMKELRAEKCIIIDPWQKAKDEYDDWRGVGLYNLEKVGCSDIVEFYNCPSELQLPKLLEMRVSVDFAFIDGWHTFDHCLLDFFYINRLLNVGGVVCFHDVDWPSVSKVIKYVTNYPAYEIYAYLPRTAKQIIWSIVRDAIRFAVKFRHRRNIFVDACIAFKKVDEDKRLWTWYKDF